MKLFECVKCPILKSILISVFFVVFIAGCGGSGGGGNPPEDPPKIMKGSALIPAGRANPKPVFSKILPGTTAFGGATITARSLTTGTTYNGATSVDSEGNFTIESAPFGDDYLVTARKGNILVMKIVSVGGEEASPFEIGEVDAASTAAVLMLNNLVGDLGLISGTNGNLDQDQINAIHDHDPAQIEINIENIISPPEGSPDPPHVDETGGNPINIDTLIINNDNSVNSNNVSYLNTYLFVFNIVTAGDESADETSQDVLNDWLDNGTVVGITVTADLVEVTVDATGSPSAATITVDLKPEDLDDDIAILEDPETSLTEKPALLSNTVTASFEFTSDQSSVTFECEIDGTGFFPCTSPHQEVGLADGNHTFLVAAKDSEGKTDLTPARYVWEVDTTAPDTTIETKPADPTNSTEATFEFSSDDSSATFECKINGGGFSPCTNPKTYPGLSEGEHTVMVRAIDSAGNADATPDSHTWTVDVTGPIVSIDPPTPDDPTNQTTATFHFSANEAATFICDLNGTVDTACTSPKTYTGLSDGERTFTVSAVDTVGNPGNSPSFVWAIETIAPDTSITSKPPNPSASNDATFEFGADEPATFKCNLDGGEWESCTNPKTYTGLAAGSHNFMVRATDLAGNTDPTPAEWDWDITVVSPPDTIIDSGPSDPTSETSAVFTFHEVPSDAATTFECMLDSGAWEGCTSPKMYTGLSDGAHSFKVRATLDGKTDPTPATWDWTISSEPDTFIDSGPSGSTTDTFADFTFSSDKVGATFECKLDSGAWEPCVTPKNYPGPLANGVHTFMVRATFGGKTDGTPATRTWTVGDISPPIFFDDFEGVLTDKWLTSWGLTETDSVSATHSAADSPEGNYPANANTAMTLLNPIDLAGTTSPVLTFWQKIGVYGSDHGYLEISEDGGFSWDVLIDQTNTWQSTWNHIQVDLSAYKTTPIKIRFRVRDNGDSFRTWGWDIDDVEIREKNTAMLPFPFSEDFESGLGDWLTSWSLATSDSVSPTNSSADSPDANYPAYANTGMTLVNPIDLSGTTAPVLTFWQKIGVYGSDHGYLEISEDGGFTWSVIIDQTNTWQSTWNHVQVDLSAYKTTPIKIRFRVRDNGDSFRTWGWDIDDVQIREKNTAMLSFPFSEDFESGLGDWLTSWSLATSDSVSPTNSSADSPDANYSAYANTSMTLINPIDLSVTTSPILTFWHKIGVYGSDHGYLEISEDGGFTWDTPLLDFTNTWISTWTFVQVDLSAYKTSPIKIRFRVRDNGDSFRTWGWDIDDIQIKELF